MQKYHKKNAPIMEYALNAEISTKNTPLVYMSSETMSREGRVPHL